MSARHTGRGPGEHLLVTVIAPVRNEAESIRVLIARLADQTLGSERFEVVGADDGSTDGSALALGVAGLNVHVAHGPPLNAYAARNRAVLTSRAPTIASCDADCAPEPAWLEAGLRALSTADIVA